MLDQTKIFKKLYISIILISFVLFFSGCMKNFNPFKLSRTTSSSQPAAQLSNAAENIYDNSKDIIESQKKIQHAAGNIDEASSDLLTKVEDPTSRKSIYNIQDESKNILSESMKSSRAATDIVDDTGIVNNAGKVLEKTEANLREYEAEGAAEARKNLYKMILGMAAAGGLIIAAGIMLSFFNPKLGGMVAGFGLIITTIATAGTYYLKWIALIGFILLGAGLLITIGFLVKSFLYAKHLKESHEGTVKLIDELKNEIPENVKEDVFGDDGILNQTQSKATKKIISKTRANIDKKKIL